jgi:hypothetical protein
VTSDVTITENSPGVSEQLKGGEWKDEVISRTGFSGDFEAYPGAIVGSQMRYEVDWYDSIDQGSKEETRIDISQ